MKKVLQISNYLYPHIGGIEQVARTILNAAKGAYEQKIICFNHEKGTTRDFVDGVEITRVGCQTKIASQSIAISYGKELKKIMREFKPDIVIFHYPNPFVAHFLLRYRKKKFFKLILYWHLDITKQKIIGKFFHHQNIKLIKMSDEVFGATPIHIKDSKYFKYFEDKAFILPYAIDENRLVVNEEEKKIATEIRSKNEGKIICFALGRHVPYKGMEYLVRASKLLDDKYVIFIGGKGPLTESLIEKAKDDSKVHFLGRIDDSTWRSYLLASDIFCFPSITKNEGFGLALAEAMYFGKPSITFHIDGSGVNYVNIKDLTGLEVENKNVDEYAKAIQKLGNDQELRLIYGVKARQRVFENFTFERFRDVLLRKIEE